LPTNILSTSNAVFFVLLTLSCQLVSANCEDLYQDKTVTWIVPDALDTMLDTYSREAAEWYSANIEADVVVINVAGDNGHIGARRIKEAFPDGTSVGIIDGEQRVLEALIKGQEIPEFDQEFEVLTQIYHQQLVWVTSPDSEIQDMTALLEVAKTRPINVAVDAKGSPSAISLALTAYLLNIQFNLVEGDLETKPESLVGTAEGIDFTIRDLQSVYEAIESKELVPILQINDNRHAFNQTLEGIHSLAGKKSVSHLLFPEDEAKQNLAHGIVALSSLGLFIVSPPDLSKFHVDCIKAALQNAFNKPDVRRQAAKFGRSFYVAGKDRTFEWLEQVKENAEVIHKILTTVNVSSSQN
jgi:tripartite-type tricarboxylate transporter receptor subunit TctC